MHKIKARSNKSELMSLLQRCVAPSQPAHVEQQSLVLLQAK